MSILYIFFPGCFSVTSQVNTPPSLIHRSTRPLLLTSIITMTTAIARQQWRQSSQSQRVKTDNPPLMICKSEKLVQSERACVLNFTIKFQIDIFMKLHVQIPANIKHLVGSYLWPSALYLSSALPLQNGLF